MNQLANLILASLPALAVSAAEPHHLLQFQTLTLNETFYCEGANVADLNGDGDQDVISGPYWYEGPSLTTKHAFYEPKPFDPGVYSDNFFAFTHDFNADSRLDILVIGFPGQDASWYENPGPGGINGHWKRHVVMEVVDNESPTFTDLTGDGRPEIVCSTGDRFGYAAPDWKRPDQPWTFHPLSAPNTTGGRFTHGMGVGDVNGDGRLDLLEKTGWWEQPSSLDGDPLWTKHPFPFAEQGGAQMYAYDVDGDGDQDVITSLAAHAHGLAWYEHRVEDGAITFDKHLIMGATSEENPYGLVFNQLHAIDLVDMDGDGLKDIVTGQRYWAHGKYDAGTLIYWFKTTRTDSGVDFVPFLVSNVSGLGTQIVAGDLNKDGLPDVVVGNKRGTYAYLQSRTPVSREEWNMARPKKNNAAGYSPEEAAAAMTVPPGFKVKLVAGEPRVQQPIAMAIDDRGRLWIAEAYSYPVRLPDGQGRDRILIFEDADGDGSFETRKVFVDNLNLVSGLEVGFGGVWVGAAPYFMFIPDRNQDDVPDGEPEILLDGWHYEDTHEVLNAFNWGPDGWLYGCHGVFTHSLVGKPGTPDAERIPLNAAVWRYHPTRHLFEAFARGTSNPWGVDFNDEGQAFLTACVIPHLYHVIQGARYQRQGGTHFNPYLYDDIKTIADHSHYTGDIRDSAHWGHAPALSKSVSDAGGGHAHCGLTVYLGDNFPESYRGTLLFDNIHGHRLNNDRVVRRGSGYVGQHAEDFLFANDQWFLGINLRYGPDGSVFLIDWYDEESCHRGDPEIWDRSNGRIYNVAFGEPKPLKVNLAAKTDLELVELQLHRNDWYVRVARRLLQERAARAPLPPAVHARLASILRDNPDHTRKLRALWALHVINGLTDEMARECLASPEEYVRAWTIQLMAEEENVPPAFLPRLARLATSDPSPVVRLYLASALQRLPLEQRWDIASGLVSHASDQNDHNLPLMIWYGIEPTVTTDPPRAMALAGRSAIPLVTRFITRRAAGDPNGLESIIRGMELTDSNEQRLLMLGEIMNALQGHTDVPMPKAWNRAYEVLVKCPDADVRKQAEFLAVLFGDHRIFPSLRQTLADPSADLAARQRALTILLKGGDKEVVPVLHALLADRALRAEALSGLIQFDHPATPRVILERYAAFSPEEQRLAIHTLASRPAYAKALLNAMEAGAVSRQDVSAFTIRQMYQLGDEALKRQLAETWGSIRETSADKAELQKKYKSLLTPAALAGADPSHGRELYNLVCYSCHTLYGQGNQIGPDLTGSNRRNLDYVLENVLDPSAVLGQDYRNTTVETKDDRVVSGLLVKETDSAVTIRTLAGDEVVARNVITSMDTLSQSMMPEGLFEALPSGDVIDLVAYLQTESQVPMPGEAPAIDPATGKVPDALEGEALQVLSKKGNARPQAMGGFSQGKWSGQSQLWWTDAKPGDRLVLQLPVPQDGTYAVYLSMTKAKDYGIVQHHLDGTPLGPQFDLFNEQVNDTGPVLLGEVNLKQGNHELAVEIVGSNPKAVQAHMYALDYIKLGRLKTP